MIRFSASEKELAVRIGALSAVIGSLTLLMDNIHIRLIQHALFFPLMPGVMAEMLIAGVHGDGNYKTDCIAAAVNIICYVSAFLLFQLIRRYLVAQRTPTTKGTP